MSVHALVRFGLNTPNALRLARFYEQAFGALVQGRERRDAPHFAPGGAVSGGAARTLLRLGDATLELLEFDHPGRPPPTVWSPYDIRFQHFALVVADMQSAMQRLSQAPGWTAISTAGPQTLPQRAGGVAAFKFQDPDGHPLELLQFPESKTPLHWRAPGGSNAVLGIDHSAISVAHVQRSVDFYEALGLQTTLHTLNVGQEQERLDGVSDPQVDVICLAPAKRTPHVELLHYRTAIPRPQGPLASNDIAATRLTFSASKDRTGAGSVLCDPDGHFLEILSSSASPPSE